MAQVGISTSGIGTDRGDAVTRLLERFHRYTGHAAPSTMAKALKAYDLHIPLMYLNNIQKNCKGCLLSRKNQGQYKSTQSTNDGVTCYVDITEPKTVKGFQGAKYIIVFVEDGDESVHAEVLNRKADALLSIINYLNYNPHINIMRVDNAGELTSNAVKDGLMRKFVGLETVAPGVSESNGKVERKHQHLKSICERFMADCGCALAPELWPWFVQAAVNAVNSSWNDRSQGIPADLRRRRLNIKSMRCPYATGDVVNFTYRNEEKS